MRICILNLENSEGRGTEQQVGKRLQDRRTLGSVPFNWPEETTEECLVITRVQNMSPEFRICTISDWPIWDDTESQLSKYRLNFQTHVFK